MKETKAIEPKALSNYQPGSILCDSWGYDQTNYDFYCVVERKGEWVRLAKMTKEKEEYNSQAMTQVVSPGVIDESAPIVRKKIKMRNGKEIGFSMRDYSGGGWVHPWDGKPKTSTHYA